jgi:hypothetical protein
VLDKFLVLGVDRGLDGVAGGAALVKWSGIAIASRYEQWNARELRREVVGVVLLPGCSVGLRITPQREGVGRSLRGDESELALGHVAGKPRVDNAAE